MVYDSVCGELGSSACAQRQVCWMCDYCTCIVIIIYILIWLGEEELPEHRESSTQSSPPFCKYSTDLMVIVQCYNPQLKTAYLYLKCVHVTIKKTMIYSNYLGSIKWKSIERTYMQNTVQNPNQCTLFLGKLGHTFMILLFSCSYLPCGMSFSVFREFMISIEV